MNHIELTARLWSAYSGQEYKAEDVSAMLMLRRIAIDKIDRENEEQGLIDMINSLDVGKEPENTKGKSAARTYESSTESTSAPSGNSAAKEKKETGRETTEHPVAKETGKKSAKKPEKKAGAKLTKAAAEPKRKLDDGKIRALRNAGWSLTKIADEMDVSAQTILNHINRMEGKE